MEAAEAAAGVAVVKPPAVALSEPPASAGLPQVSALVCKARLQWLKARLFSRMRSDFRRDTRPPTAGPLRALARCAPLRHWCYVQCGCEYSARR
jgi:hypothetical protein